MSNSILTISFFLNSIKFVSCNVLGITVISNAFGKIFEIVKDTPLIEIEPYSTIYFLYFFDN